MMLILGDPHIGGGSALGKSIPGQPINTRIQDQFNILNWVLDTALSNNVSEIIITGDVFDDPKPSHILINLFCEWCKKVASNDIDIHIIAGNHDLLRYGNDYYSPLDILFHTDCVEVYKEETVVNIGKTSILFYPFRDRKSYKADTTDLALKIIQNTISDSISKMKYKNKLCIGHFAIEGSVYYDEVKDITNELLVPTSYFEKFSNTIMGHIHSPQDFDNNVKLIGSMDISNFGETNHQKRIILLSEDVYKEIPIPTRQLNKIKLEIPDNIENTTEYLLENLKSQTNLVNSITKIEVSIKNSLAKNIDRKVIEDYLISQGVYNICGMSETKTKEIKKSSTEIKFDMSLDSAIKKYAERFNDENIKEKFIEVSFDIVKKLSEA